MLASKKLQTFGRGLIAPAIALLIGLPASTSAWARLATGPDSSWEDSQFKYWFEKGFNGTHEQQTRYELVDPKGDAILLHMLDTVAYKLTSVLGGDHKYSETVYNNPNLRIGAESPLYVDRLMNAALEVVRAHPEITPTIGMEQKWSPDADRYLRYLVDINVNGNKVTVEPRPLQLPYALKSKLFYLLACGWTSRYAFTGLEEPLREDLLGYPDRSVQLLDVFRESYLLARGDLYIALLTAENVLAGDPYAAHREDEPLQHKLAYIRNDNIQAGNNYGAWYHFFGIALYGLVREHALAEFVGDVEHFGALFMNGFDRQKGWYNELGGDFGDDLKQMVAQKTYLLPATAGARSDYMHLVEIAQPALASPAGANPGKSK